MVPFIDLARFETGFMERWQQTVAQMSAKAQFVGGAAVSDFEKYLRSALQVHHAVSCANGTDALQLALRAVGVRAGDCVLIPDATFWATFESVVNVGATPICVDIDMTDGAMCHTALKDALTQVKPKAVIVAHLYGWCSQNLAQIRALCAAKNIPLIEDGAQCYGTLLEGTPIYTDAACATISFYPAKVLGAAGDAGAVVAKHESYAQNARVLSNHGRTQHYGHSDVGWNSRMDALQAAYLNIAKDYITARIKSRVEIAQIYRNELGSLLTVLAPPKNVTENGYCNVCLIPDADLKTRIETQLKQDGIGFGNIYPGAMSTQPGANAYQKQLHECRNSVLWSEQVLNLPLFSYMRADEIETVIASVRKVLPAA